MVGEPTLVLVGVREQMMARAMARLIERERCLLVLELVLVAEEVVRQR
jgi:hypothetical protein